MESKSILKVKKQDIMFYFVFFAFLYPRGFSEIIPLYKTIFSVWTWTAVCIIWIQFFFIRIKKNIMRLKINWDYIVVGSYFVFAILITVFTRQIVDTGLQQLIGYPSLFVFIVVNFKRKPERVLNCISNILFVLFLINLCIFRGRFFYIEHMTFLGHVQAISQLGVLTIFVSVLEYMMTNKHRKKTILIVILTIFNMSVTDADSAVLSAMIIIFAGIAYKWRLYHLFKYKSTVYVWAMCVVSILVIYFIAIDGTILEYIPNLNFSGRNYVWEDAILKIGERMVVGYGIDGVLLTPFWTEWTGGGFNYAHNQILQNLLDGGIILLASFWGMIFRCIRDIDNILKRKYVVLVNVTLSVLLFIMIFESVSLYCYVYILLAIMLVLPQILDKEKK